MTAIALSLPLLVILWPRIRDAAGRRNTLVAIAAGLVICAVVPFWNHAVLDSWTTLPYSEYSARTFPFDMPTWRVNWSPPARELPPDFVALADEQRPAFERRSVDSLPRTFVARTDRLGASALPYDLHALRYLAPLGLLAAGGAGIAALASALLLLLAHLTMPHPPNWTIYYLDVFPVVAFGVVVALRRAAELAAPRVRGAASLARYAPAGAFAAALALLGAGGTIWRPQSADENGWMHREIVFRGGVCALPPGKKVVFVQPRPGSSVHHNLVDNDPRWMKSDLWIVRFWKPELHKQLLDAAPDRAAYLYDEQAGWLAKMNRDGTPTHEGVVSVLQASARAGHGLTCS